MANEIEKLVEEIPQIALDGNKRLMVSKLRRLVKKAYLMRVSHDVVDPYYRTKDVLRGMTEDFKTTFGFDKPK